jgi:hypothetical protein
MPSSFSRVERYDFVLFMKFFYAALFNHSLYYYFEAISRPFLEIFQENMTTSIKITMFISMLSLYCCFAKLFSVVIVSRKVPHHV